MPERTLCRIASVSAVLGAILGLVANVLHPRYRDVGDTEAYLRVIAASDIWVAAHIGGVLAALLTTGGLVGLARSITKEPGAAWARLAEVGAVVGFALFCVLQALDGIVAKRVAVAWAASPAAEKAMAFRVGDLLEKSSAALFALWVLVFVGVTFVLYGLAVVRGSVYPVWLGWVALLAGVGSTWVGLVIAYQGPSPLYVNGLFVVFSLLLTLWVLVMGVLLGRRVASAV